ncbi:MAG: hypothetical protein G01um101430_30 [Parcubacteria group bacterium Gr01-1014_30]|nr:MAG: hypothetical protein G01um101430_30 [Parcubacteria group bacterium Gr01-1014_30]
MLYQNTADKVDEFVRKCRKAERILRRKEGAFVSADFAIAKVQEIIAVAETLILTDELTLQIPALPCPTFEDLREKYPWIREEEGIERDTSPTEAVTFHLGTVIREGEHYINGAEYERRLQPKQDILHGYQQANWLVEHQDEHPAFVALLGKVYIDFPGIVVVNSDSGRCVACLDQGGRRWCLHWGWLGRGVDRRGRIAVSGK